VRNVEGKPDQKGARSPAGSPDYEASFEENSSADTSHEEFIEAYTHVSPESVKADEVYSDFHRGAPNKLKIGRTTIFKYVLSTRLTDGARNCRWNPTVVEKTFPGFSDATKKKKTTFGTRFSSTRHFCKPQRRTKNCTLLK